MCYSAQCWADYRKYLRFNAHVEIEEFARLFGFKRIRKIRTPKAMDAAFEEPANEAERAIKEMIAAINGEQIAQLEAEMFKQKKRLADAERKLLEKETKAARESQRIATTKLQQLLGRLADIKRVEPKPKDSRMFPGWYAPVMIWENGQRVIKPMRYQCRPAGKPASYDIKYPGTYNARRDNLEGFWKGQFGRTHGVMLVDRFYENVSRHAMEGRPLAPDEREENVVLEFIPRPAMPMMVACLWSHWTDGAGDDLWSFAAITDHPPPEVALAGHDRCIIAIKEENLDAWLRPDPANLPALQAILDDKATLHYEHRLAA